MQRQPFAQRDISIMQGFLAREWSLWNQVQLGFSKFKNEDRRENEPCEDQGSVEFRDNAHSGDELIGKNKPSGDFLPNDYRDWEDEKLADEHYVDLDPEKQVFIEESDDTDDSRRHAEGQGRKAKHGIWSWTCYFVMALCILCHLLDKDTRPSKPCNMAGKAGQETAKAHGLFSDVSSPYFKQLEASENGTKLHEFIEIPVLPALEYGKPVYQQHLLNATFGNSWGIPTTAQYVPPPASVNFSQVVLTLNVWIAGIQFDRLIHVYIDENEVWRSSTPEPAGRDSHTFTQKDVSLYGSLFRKNTQVMLQLDNLITSKLTGVFNVSLDAFYYNYQGNRSLVPHKDQLKKPDGGVNVKDVDDVIIPGRRNNIFQHSEDANHIIALTKTFTGRPPLVYYPDSRLHVVLPQVNANTTQARVMIYISGNAEEEFWYSNLLDEYKDRFRDHGHTFGGHGPCRVINVYHNGVRIDSRNPFPVIYTGGISPALWNPIVSTGSYDIIGLSLDVSLLLPYLWQGPEALDFEVSNCFDDDLPSGASKSGIGSNWISSASLALWEDEHVVHSEGEVQIADNSTKVSSIAIVPPFSGFMNQIVTAKYSNQIRTYFNFTFANGTSLDFIAEHYTTAHQSNIQVIKGYGDKQTLVAVQKGQRSHAILNATDNSTFFSYNLSSSHPLVVSIEKQKAQSLPPDSSYKVSLVKGSTFKMRLNGSKILKLKVSENGTSNMTLSPNGNHGEGRVEHNLTISTKSGHVYNRHALGDNTTLVYDNVTIIEPLDGSMSLDDALYGQDEPEIVSSLSEALAGGLGDLNGLVGVEDEDDKEAYEAFIEYLGQDSWSNDDAEVSQSATSRKYSKGGLFRHVLFN